MTVADVSGWAAQHRRIRQLAARGLLCETCRPAVVTRADIDVVTHSDPFHCSCAHGDNGDTPATPGGDEQ